MTNSTILVFSRRGKLKADVVHVSVEGAPRKRDVRRVIMVGRGRLTPLAETTRQDSGEIIGREQPPANPFHVFPATLITP